MGKLPAGGSGSWRSSDSTSSAFARTFSSISGRLDRKIRASIICFDDQSIDVPIQYLIAQLIRKGLLEPFSAEAVREPREFCRPRLLSCKELSFLLAGFRVLDATVERFLIGLLRHEVTMLKTKRLFAQNLLPEVKRLSMTNEVGFRQYA